MDAKSKPLLPASKIKAKTTPKTIVPIDKVINFKKRIFFLSTPQTKVYQVTGKLRPALQPTAGEQDNQLKRLDISVVVVDIHVTFEQPSIIWRPSSDALCTRIVCAARD